MTNSLQEKLKAKEKIIGSIASAIAIIMIASQIEILLSNLKGESRIFIQPLTTSFSGFFWSLYGYGRKDWFILIPNAMALVLGAVTAISAFI